MLLYNVSTVNIMLINIYTETDSRAVAVCSTIFGTVFDIIFDEIFVAVYRRIFVLACGAIFVAIFRLTLEIIFNGRHEGLSAACVVKSVEVSGNKKLCNWFRYETGDVGQLVKTKMKKGQSDKERLGCDGKNINVLKGRGYERNFGGYRKVIDDRYDRNDSGYRK